jgi:PAS domain S-box-containing protein
MKKRPTYEVLEERSRVLETESIQGRQSDGALSQSENQFRSIVELAPEAIHLQRGGRFIYLNRAMLNLLGYSRPEELLGQDCVKHVAPEYRDAVAERIRFLQETGKPAPLMEQEYLRRDGSRIAVETTGAAIHLEGGEAYLIFARDITERKEADEAIRAGERRYRQLFENMTEGVALHEMIYNLDGQAVDYRIVETNASYHKHTGISAGPLHDILATALYGTDTPPYLEEYEEVARTGKPITFETFFPPMNKHFSITVFSPGPGFFATVFEDITELRQSVEALKKSEEQLPDAHRLAHIGVWKWTAETDTVGLTSFTASQASIRCFQRQHMRNLPAFILQKAGTC